MIHDMKRPQFIFQIFLFPFWAWLFGPIRVPAKVQIFFGSVAGPLTLLLPKMELLGYREPRELENMGFLHFTWFYDSMKFECNPTPISLIDV